METRIAIMVQRPAREDVGGVPISAMLSVFARMADIVKRAHPHASVCVEFTPFATYVDCTEDVSENDVLALIDLAWLEEV